MNKNFMIFFILFALPVSWITTNIDAYFAGGKFVYTPNLKTKKFPKEENMRGVSGEKNISWNSYGLRGPEFGKEKLRILTVGNSLSECLYLDDKETWQRVLRNNLRTLGHDVEIFDASLSGLLSSAQVINVIENYKHIYFDMVIFYPLPTFVEGTNSLTGFTKTNIPDLLNEDFSIKNNNLIREAKASTKRAISYLSKFFPNQVSNPNFEDIYGGVYRARRKIKQGAEVSQFREEFELQRALNKEKGMNALISYLQNKSFKSFFISELDMALLNPSLEDQTTMWGRTFKENGKLKKYSLEDEKRLLTKWQEIEKETLKGKNHLTSDDFKNISPAWFYDHHHFNVDGAKQFANNLTHHIDKLLKK